MAVCHPGGRIVAAMQQNSREQPKKEVFPPGNPYNSPILTVGLPVNVHRNITT